MKLVSSLAVAMLAACAALADETRISVGYGTVDLHFSFLYESPSAMDGKGYYLRAEGDEGDFLYSLSFGRHSATGSDVFPPSPPEIPNPTDADLEHPEIETAGASLGWHGLNMGGIGFGPVISYERVAHSDGTVSSFFTDPIDEATMEQTVAGVLMRTETDNFDFSATVGSIIMGNAWEHGLAMSIAADVHVSDAVTLTGDWTRAWGLQSAWAGEFDNEFNLIYENREIVSDAFGLGGRVRVADGVFLEGWMTRARNGTYIDFGQDNWFTTLNLGVGTFF